MMAVAASMANLIWMPVAEQSELASLHSLCVTLLPSFLGKRFPVAPH